MVRYNNSEIVRRSFSKDLAEPSTENTPLTAAANAGILRDGGEHSANKNGLCGIVRASGPRPRIFKCSVCGRVLPGYPTLPGGGWRTAKHGTAEADCPGYSHPAIITDQAAFAKFYPPRPEPSLDILSPRERRLAEVALRHSRSEESAAAGLSAMLHACVLSYLADLAERASIFSDGGGI